MRRHREHRAFLEDRTMCPKPSSSQPKLGVSKSNCGGGGGVNGRQIWGLPQVLTIRCLLHQPPILTEVICGFAQEAENCVILPGQGREDLAVSPLQASALREEVPD